VSTPAREAAALAAALFALYAWGACPTIYVGDSGELVTAAYTLGIPHPSGYPLYVLLGKAWTELVRVGSIAYRMSLFSAAAAAAACGLLHLLARREGLGRPAAATAALLLAASPSFWGEANVPRVYALNALFLVLAASLALRWHRRGREHVLALAFFVAGLGAANHTFMGIAGGVVAAFALWRAPGLLRRPRALAAGAAAFALGLLPYLYLPLRSRADPFLDWGDPETPGRFLDVVLRRDFWGRAWFTGPADLLPIAADYAVGLARELHWAGAALALAGIAAGLRRRAPVALPLLIMAANLAAVALHGSRSDIFIWHRYYIPSYAMAALLAGLGAEAAASRLPRALRALPLAVPLAGLALGFAHFDRSRYAVADDFSRQLLEGLPPGAHLAASDDNVLFTLIYLQRVEGLRPDVDLILQGVGQAPLPPLRFEPGADPLFFTHHPNWREPRLAVVPVGLAYEIARAGGPPPPLRLPRPALRGEDDPRVPKDYLTQNLIGHFHFMLGSTLQAHDWRRAAAELERAAAAAPGNDVLFFNLGLVYRGQGLHAEALAAFERSHAINPRAIASRSVAEAGREAEATRRELARLAEVEARLGGAAPPCTLAVRLEAAGEPLAARGHRRRALRAGQACPTI
jgi:tetratricopeptide (TPR) repeat protein